MQVDQNQRERLQLKRSFGDYLDPGNEQGPYYHKVKVLLKEGKTRLTINLNDLRRHDPSLWENFLKNPMGHIPAFEEAFEEYVKNDESFNLKNRTRNKKFKLGFDGAFGSKRVDPKKLHSSNITNLMCIEGIVTKVGLVRPKVVMTEHYAEKSKKWVNQRYRDTTSFEGPPTGSSYPKETEDGDPLTTEFGRCNYKDHQMVTIQDMPERTTAGTMPRSVDCVIDDDLVDAVKPGDRVSMIGVYRTLAHAASGTHSGQFRTVLIVNNVKKIVNDQSTQLTGDDIKVMKKLAKKNDVFDIVSRSIAPSIFGHEYIKKALVLMLLGGVEKNLKNGTHIRGDINILLVGDPSTAKSQTLRAVMNAAPLAINTTGRGATGVGLTAAVVQDRDSGERRLEAGAMVLADRGVVCIDEFDKMSDGDRVAIHEVMEQQTVTIAKAGIHTTLNARCSVIAASNPVYGQYDRNRKPHENIALPDSLLSRFDLLFIVLDKLDTELDRAIADHVLGLHQSRRKEIESNMYADMEDEDQDMEYDANDIWEKAENMKKGAASALRRRKGDDSSFLKMDFCKKYIAYCKQKCKPKLTDAATEEMAQVYVKLREEEQNGTLPITARAFETLIRLSAAHAKLRLSKVIEKKDVKEIYAILRYALKSSEISSFDDDEDMEQEKNQNEMEVEEEVEEEEEKEEPQRRRRRRQRDSQSQSSQSQSQGPAKRARGGFTRTQKKTVMKAITTYWRQDKTEMMMQQLRSALSKGNVKISDAVCDAVIDKLDEEGKIYFVKDENKILKM